MKPDRDRMPLFCKVNPLGLSPSSRFDAELLDEYPKGTEVEVYIKRKRSLPQMRLYWKLLHEVIATTGAKYPSAEHLHDGLKLALGYTSEVINAETGEVHVIPDSVAFSRMDQRQFQEFFQRAQELLARLTGVDPLSLLSEAA